MGNARHTMKTWARLLSSEDEPLTMSEGQFLATIAIADRSVETLLVLQDIRDRLARMEIFLSRMVPEYDSYARQAIYAALAESHGPSRNGEAGGPPASS